MSGRALVLGSGGLTGIAWLIGMIAGLDAEGVSLDDADLVVGTSAGAVVGTVLRSDLGVDELYAEQLDESRGLPPVTVSVRARWWSAVTFLRPGDPVRSRVWIGRRALAAEVVADDHRATIAARLPEHEWPRRPLALTAVDAVSGAFATFDQASGVPLVDAVAASCAVPGVWSPVRIDGRHWIDGGMRSSVNADVARGYDRVVVLAPIGIGIRREIRRLGADARVAVVTPDRAARRAMGVNALDSTRRPAAARAGRGQARAVAAGVAGVWRE